MNSIRPYQAVSSGGLVYDRSRCIFTKKEEQSPKSVLQLSKRFQNVLDRKYGSLRVCIELQNISQLRLSFELGLYENNKAPEPESPMYLLE